MDNLIGRSGQGWKFTLGCLVVSSAGLLVLASSAPHDAADALAAAAAGAIVAAIAVAVAVTLSLRCPDCRARWIWMALSRLDHTAWVGWLRTLQACPVCGYRGPAEPREESVPRLVKRPLFTDWRDLDRDAILALIFFPAIVVGAVALEGGPWTTGFWVCCVVVVLCLVLARAARRSSRGGCVLLHRWVRVVCHFYVATRRDARDGSLRRDRRLGALVDRSP